MHISYRLVIYRSEIGQYNVEDMEGHIYYTGNLQSMIKEASLDCLLYSIEIQGAVILKTPTGYYEMTCNQVFPV